MTTPQDFLLQAFAVTVSQPFQETRLSEASLAAPLGLLPSDTKSCGKARATAISMVLSLAYRAVLDAFTVMYADQISGLDGLKPIVIKAVPLFDAIVDTEWSKDSFPAYVDHTYLPRWRKRYEQSAMQPTSPPLRIATLTTFFQQITFSHASEPAVTAQEQKIVLLGEDIYDNYVVAFRSLLGQRVLR